MNIIQELEKELRPLIVHDTGTAYVPVSLLERLLKTLIQCEFLVSYPDKQLTFDYLEWLGWDIADEEERIGYPPATPAALARPRSNLPDPINNKEDIKYITEGVAKLGTGGMVSEQDAYYSNLLSLVGGYYSVADHASPRQIMLAILKTVQPYKFNTLR